MSRIRTMFSVVVPSMIAGGLVFGSAFGHAASGDQVFGFWPASDAAGPIVAQAGSGVTPPAPAPKTPAPPTPPTPPTTKTPPTPPTPPTKPGKGGVSVQINNGSIKIDGIKDTVIEQLDAVRDQLKNNKQIPKDVRDKVLPRLDKVRESVNKRLTNLNVTDLDKLGDEMEKMSEEIEQAMEGLDDDLSKLGDKLGKDIAKQLGKNFGKIDINFGGDDDDDDDIDIPDVDVDADDDDLRDAISDLKDVALKPAQRDAIVKLRNDSDKQVGAAKKELDALSSKLQTALGDAKTSDADIGRYVDQISAKEAQIRKARILAWVQARRVLDDAQRKKIEDAAKKKTK